MRSGRPLLEQIVNDKELLALYRKRAKKLLETHFEPKRLGERLDKQDDRDVACVRARHRKTLRAN
jgi:hypothetical protein